MPEKLEQVYKLQVTTGHNLVSTFILLQKLIKRLNQECILIFSRPIQGENLLDYSKFTHNGMRRKRTKDAFKVQFRINRDEEEHNRSKFGQEANELNLGHLRGKVQKSEVLV